MSPTSPREALETSSKLSTTDVNPFAQELRMDLQRFFFYLYENSENGMDKENQFLCLFRSNEGL